MSKVYVVRSFDDGGQNPDEQILGVYISRGDAVDFAMDCVNQFIEAYPDFTAYKSETELGVIYLWAAVNGDAEMVYGCVIKPMDVE